MSVFTNDVTVEPGSAPIEVDSSTLAKDTSVLALTKPSDTQLVDGSAHTQPISAASLPLPSGAATDATVATLLTNTQLRASPVPVSGTVTTSPVVSSSATIARVATSNSSTVILAANANRKKAIIMTETGTSNYIAFAGTASATAYTYLIGSTTVLEVTTWQGAISLIRASGSGNVQVTELV